MTSWTTGNSGGKYITVLILVSQFPDNRSTDFKWVDGFGKMPPQPASGGISRERLTRGSPNFTRLSSITGPTNLLDMTLLVPSGRLQNVIKYWTKVMRNTGPAGQRVE